jgi:putative hemolysin
VGTGFRKKIMLKQGRITIVSQRASCTRAGLKPAPTSFVAAAFTAAFLAMTLAAGPQTARALANPASVFCVQSGGKSEIRKGPNGEYGVCRLPDGRVVEEWTYYRKMQGRNQ